MYALLWEKLDALKIFFRCRKFSLHLFIFTNILYNDSNRELDNNNLDPSDQEKINRYFLFPPSNSPLLPIHSPFFNSGTQLEVNHFNSNLLLFQSWYGLYSWGKIGGRFGLYTKTSHRLVKGYDKYTNSSSTGPQVIIIMKMEKI